MPISRQVRETGEVFDIHGVRVLVGVDHDCVTVGGYVLNAVDTDELIRLLTEARAVASAQAGTVCHGACCFGRKD